MKKEEKKVKASFISNFAKTDDFMIKAWETIGKLVKYEQFIFCEGL